MHSHKQHGDPWVWIIKWSQFVVIQNTLVQDCCVYLCVTCFQAHPLPVPCLPSGPAPLFLLSPSFRKLISQCLNQKPPCISGWQQDPAGVVIPIQVSSLWEVKVCLKWMVLPKAHILLWAPSPWAALLLRSREEREGTWGGLQVACARDSHLDLARLDAWTFAFSVWIWTFEDNIKEVYKFSVLVIILKSYISFPWQESSSEAQLAPSANASYGHHRWREWGSHHFCCHGYCFRPEHQLVLGPAPVPSYHAPCSMSPSCPFIHSVRWEHRPHDFNDSDVDENPTFWVSGTMFKVWGFLVIGLRLIEFIFWPQRVRN